MMMFNIINYYLLSFNLYSNFIFIKIYLIKVLILILFYAYTKKRNVEFLIIFNLIWKYFFNNL